jgi:hypothetical protein
MRSLSIVLLVAVFGPLAACSPAGLPVAAPASSAATATPTIELTASAEATQSPRCADGFPRQIPASSMIPGGVEACADSGDGPDVVPRLCLTDKDMQVTDLRTMRHTVSETLSSGPAPTDFSQTVLVFKPGTAAIYFSRLRAALSSCPSRTQAGVKITYATRAGGPEAGEESVSLSAEYRHLKPPEVGPQVSTYRVIVVRVGDRVSVIYDHGWEGAPSLDQTIFNATTEGARLISGSL